MSQKRSGFTRNPDCGAFTGRILNDLGGGHRSAGKNAMSGLYRRITGAMALRSEARHSKGKAWQGMVPQSGAMRRLGKARHSKGKA